MIKSPIYHSCLRKRKLAAALGNIYNFAIDRKMELYTPFQTRGVDLDMFEILSAMRSIFIGPNLLLPNLKFKWVEINAQNR